MKKKILALVLCAAVVIGLVPAMVTAAYTDGAKLVITCNGEAVSSVALHKDEEAVLTATYDGEVGEEDAYQWQISQEGDWIGLTGETYPDITVNPGMVNGETAFRCLINWAEGNVTESEPFYVTLAEEEAEEEPEEPEESEAPGTVFEDNTPEQPDEDQQDTDNGEENSDSDNSLNIDSENNDACPICGLTDGEHEEGCENSCTCGSEDGEHEEGCPLYEEEFDVDYYYEILMDCETSNEMDEIAEEVDEEKWQLFSDEMKDDLLLHYIKVSPGQPILPVYENNSRPFTSAGPVIQYDSPSLISAYSVGAISLYDDEISVLDLDANEEEQQTEGLQLDKTATVDDNGNVTITLEAFATGESVTTYVKDGVDIVLMLDLSGYMNKTTTYSYTPVDSSTTFQALYSSYFNGTTYWVNYNGTYQQVKVTQSGRDKKEYAVTLQANNSVTFASSKRGSDTINNSLQYGGQSYILYTRMATEGSTTAKITALKTAVNSFITKVHNEAPASRIAIVTYANSADVKSGSKEANDEALVTMDDVGLTALKNIVDNLTVVGGNSNSHYAVADAVKIFQDVPITSAEYNRQRVALLFSAGVPGDGWKPEKNSTNTGNDIAQAAMHLSTILKTNKGATASLSLDSNVDGGKKWNEVEISELLGNKTNWNTGCGATVYCVGLDIPTSGNPANVDMQVAPYKDGALANEYFWRISSHRPDGSHITSPSDFGDSGQTVYNSRLGGTSYTSYYYFYPDILTRNQEDGYYLTTDSTGGGLNELEAIFKNIAGEATTNTESSTTLGTSTVVKDIVAPQFQLPKGATAKDVTIATYAFTGKSGDRYNFGDQNKGTQGATATISDDGQVSVTGFNFADNWCGVSYDLDNNETTHGYKLVISFTVEQKSGFLGGNDVCTNTSAGVYKNSSATEPVLTFPKPTVNVAIDDVTVNATDKNVYLLGGLSAYDIKSGTTVKCGSVTLDLSKADNNYGLESWQTDYVDITVTYTDAQNNTITNLNNLTDDTTYKVTVTVEPKTITPSTSSDGEAATTKTGNDEGKINVFKPELTYKDSNVYYGDNAPTSYDGNLTSTVWKHGTTVSTDTGVDMIGTAPTLSMDYTPEAGKFVDNKIATKNDIAVDVTVKIGTTDVTEKTTFQHTDCTGKTCGTPENGKFWLHVKTCQLTITKQGGASDESYVFDVYKDGKKYTEVTIWGNGSETIYELPVGTYTIQENTGWSWRYSADNGSTASLTAQTPTGKIKCTNTSNTDKWLNGYSKIIQNILGVKDKKVKGQA